MIYCVYSKATGLIRARFDTAASEAPRQLQEGEAIYLGDAKPGHHIIDHETGERVEAETRDPGDGSVWDRNDLRWITVEEQGTRQRSAALAKMESLERKAIRPMLELRDNPADAAASAKLDEIQAERALLAASLRKRPTETETSGP